MKVIAAVLIAASLTGTLTMNAQAAPRSRTIRHHGPCSGRMAVIRHDLPQSLNIRREKRMTRCAFGLFAPGQTAKALCVEDRESSFYTWARNASNHLGLFQHDSDYWPGRARTYLRDRWFPRMGRSAWYPKAFNARASILVTARMVAAGGWSPWTGSGC